MEPQAKESKQSEDQHVIIDCWSAGEKESYVFTTDRNIARELKLHFPKRAVYFQNSIPFAWQYKVPTQLLPTLVRRAKAAVSLQQPKNQALKNNDLAPVEFQELPQEGRSPLWPIHSTPSTPSATSTESDFITTPSSEAEKV